MEDPGLNCNASRIWLSFTDFQEENVYLNVGNYSYRDVFVDSAIVGNNLTDNQIFWGTKKKRAQLLQLKIFCSTLFQATKAEGISSTLE